MAEIFVDVVLACRRLQREVDLLERKIATVRRQAATGQPGGAAAAGEAALAAAVAAGDVWGDTDTGMMRSRSRGTKTAIERDKALARLGLGVIEEFPRDVLVDILQVCVTHALAVCPSCQLGCKFCVRSCRVSALHGGQHNASLNGGEREQALKANDMVLTSTTLLLLLLLVLLLPLLLPCRMPALCWSCVTPHCCCPASRKWRQSQQPYPAWKRLWLRWGQHVCAFVGGGQWADGHA